MRLGFGLYRHMLNDDNLRFAKQLGATDIIVHLCDYFNKNNRFSDSNQPIGDSLGWGYASNEKWDTEFLLRIKKQIEKHGLHFYAIENFDPCHWQHILFGTPEREQQLDTVKKIIQSVGEAGIPVFGYNFSLTSVTGRIFRHDIRGGAETVGMDGTNDIINTALPNSMAWNMVVNPQALGIRDSMTEAQLWSNFRYFIDNIIPVAEKAGVIMAAHPDDPPLDEVRKLPKLVNREQKYQQLLDCYPSPNNALEYCLGTVAEMPDSNVYSATEQYAKQHKIAYIHLRNVIGKVPHYKETFIDEGDIDIRRILTILKEQNFNGVIIPDHTPQVTCNAPWHAGMAFAMGYIKALLQTL